MFWFEIFELKCFQIVQIVCIYVCRPRIVYGACIGGGSAFTKPQFEKINGFTTVMFGWGGEDDDGYFRCVRATLE